MDLGLGYPMSVEDQRKLPDGYSGPVFIWDIDKTYLTTHFSSLRGLARIPLEFAVDKMAVVGMPEVLRGLRRGPGPGFAAAPLYFVSASPPQLRKVIEHKMMLDGVEFDGITSKDWLLTLVELRPGRLKEQVGFKVCALLEGRRRRVHASEYLFGDDVEDDASAFSLYASLVNRELGEGEADGLMKERGVRRDDRRHALELLRGLPAGRGKVKRIFIHLEKRTPPAAFEEFGRMVVPVKGASQLALALFEMGFLDRDAVKRACEAVLAGLEGRADLDELIADARKRRLVTAKSLKTLKL